MSGRASTQWSSVDGLTSFLASKAEWHSRPPLYALHCRARCSTFGPAIRTRGFGKKGKTAHPVRLDDERAHRASFRERIGVSPGLGLVGGDEYTRCGRHSVGKVEVLRSEPSAWACIPFRPGVCATDLAPVSGLEAVAATEQDRGGILVPEERDQRAATSAVGGTLTPFAGVSGSITVAPEAGYVRTASGMSGNRVSILFL